MCRIPFFISVALLILGLPILLSAQMKSGEIVFDRTSYWLKINDHLPYLSQEEKDRSNMTWGRSGGYTTKSLLVFDGERALFRDAPELNENAGNRSWRASDYLLLRDAGTNTRNDIIEMPDRTYLIEDTIPQYKWKILSEIRDIQGYICMNAETYDSIKSQRIVAWFAMDIPISSGPEGFSGLPGMILGLDINDGAVIIEATKIDFKAMEDPIQLPKRKRLKKINEATYTSLIKTYIDDSIKMERNPFWAIRY